MGHRTLTIITTLMVPRMAWYQLRGPALRACLGFIELRIQPQPPAFQPQGRLWNVHAGTCVCLSVYLNVLPYGHT